MDQRLQLQSSLKTSNLFQLHAPLRNADKLSWSGLTVSNRKLS